MPDSPSSSARTPTQKLSRSGKPLPDVGLKWGRRRTPGTSVQKDNGDDKPDFSTYYTPEEQARMRAEGVNPELKAEMEWARKRSEGKGFWAKLAQTGMGGGWIK